MIDLKKHSWISICGFIAGFSSRKIYENAKSFQNIGDGSLFDLDSIVYGLIFMSLTGLTIATISFHSRIQLSTIKRKQRIASRKSWPRFRKLLVLCYEYYILQIRGAGFSFAISAIIYVITDSILYAALPILLLPIVSHLLSKDESSDTSSIDNSFSFFGIDNIHAAIVIILTFIAILPGSYFLDGVSQTFGGGKPEFVCIKLNRNGIDDSAVLAKYDKQNILLLYRQGNVFWFKRAGDSTKIAFRRDQINYIQSKFKLNL